MNTKRLSAAILAGALLLPFASASAQGLGLNPPEAALSPRAASTLVPRDAEPEAAPAATKADKPKASHKAAKKAGKKSAKHAKAKKHGKAQKHGAKKHGAKKHAKKHATKKRYVNDPAA